ncbi:MAG: TIGR03915 family putative DNA repair protein [Opitutaceae bacterium]|nr:TIGR03915 family putative DNA repair protein [Cytophagales bacterium]
MTYLVYDATFEGLLSAIFEIYDRKIEQAFICKPEFETPDLFSSKIQVFQNEEKSDRVWKKIILIIGSDKAKNIWKVWLSELPDIENLIFRVIKYILASQADVLSDFTNADILKLQQTLKMIGREKHRMEAFVRFELTKDAIYYATIEPDFNVLPLIIKHFESRYADQKWLIYDTKRDYGIYYDLNSTEFVDFPEEKDALKPDSLDEKENNYQVLWQDYFSSTNIKARKNTKLHLRHIPKRYWKYLTEKK